MGQSALLAGMDTACNAFFKTTHGPYMDCIGDLASSFFFLKKKNLHLRVLGYYRKSATAVTSWLVLFVISFTPNRFLKPLCL